MKAIKKVYNLIPLKKQMFSFLKKLGVVPNKLYRKLSFIGVFEVEVEKNTKFKIYHNGGIIETEVFWKGLFKTWERETGWIWKELCKVSNSIFDIGANTGVYSLVAKSLNPKAKVYAFEPSDNTFNRMAYNNKLNGFDTQCEKVGVSKKTGVETFYDVPEVNQTSASLSPDKLKNTKGFTGEIVEYKVETVRLDDYIENHKIDGIDLMKLDIELHEPEAIEGLGKYLAKFEPIIIIEILRDSVADQLNQLFELNNYLIFNLDSETKATQFESFKAIPNKWNYLVFPKSKEGFVREHTSLYDKL